MDAISAGLAGAAVGLLCVVLQHLFLLRRQTSALSRVEGKLDLLLKTSGLEYDPLADIPAAVTEALKKGDKIGAIKLHREATGTGLKESKEFIEELQRRAGVGV